MTNKSFNVIICRELDGVDSHVSSSEVSAVVTLLLSGIFTIFNLLICLQLLFRMKYKDHLRLEMPLDVSKLIHGGNKKKQKSTNLCVAPFQEKGPLFHTMFSHLSARHGRRAETSQPPVFNLESSQRAEREEERK